MSDVHMSEAHAFANWTPTADNINALPERLRDYIHDLHTNRDPSGIVRENVLVKDAARALERKLEEAQQLTIPDQHELEMRREWMRVHEKRLSLDTPRQVFFYEQDHYYLSNFSAFSLYWQGRTFPTSEHAYQWSKFPTDREVMMRIFVAPSAHEAFKLAEQYKSRRITYWDEVKVDLMRDILREKVKQHEYVRRKLLETGDRELVENSWRDDYWGWGPNRNGQNMLGKLWMEVRAELRGAQQ